MTLKLLNESQLEAIRYNDGPLLVIAGAGTGKTRVITNKIAYLIKDMNVSPENILAVTFTNKAADEMARRIFQLTDKHSKNIWIGTFHSIALRMLRRDGYLLGLKPNFSVIDQDDRLSIIRDILKNINIDSKKYPPKNYLNLISNYKNSMEFIDEIEPHEDFYKFEEVFNNYQHSLREMNMVDFDDMLSLIVKVLKYNPEIKYYYRKIFQYILVDEFQDTNRIQLEFLTSICDKNGFITAVGDDDQSIYGWRGAEIRNILNFEEYFPATKIVKLTDNYRSGHKILTTANKLISNNKFRKGKDLKPFIKEHGDIIIKQFHTEIDEAIFVAGKIRDLLNLGVSAEEIAILYRANSQSRNFEVELNRLGIPFKVIGGVGFYGRREIKDILSYLKLYANPYDLQSFKRSIKIPSRGIGDSTIERVSKFSSDNGIDVLRSISELMDQFTPKQQQAFGNFLAIIDQLKGLKVSDTIKKIVELTEYETYIGQFEDIYEVEKRMDNINELINAAVQMEETGEVNINDFLSVTTLHTSNDEESNNAVKLMTIHGSKGLEFDTVFLTGLEEGVFPLFRSLENDWELEEERRLCYVGITRAKNRLFLTHSSRRLFFGKAQFLKPSPFIEEIECLDSKGSKKKVFHEKFGEGDVIKIEGNGENARVEVFFHKYGYKTIISKFLKW